MGAASHPASPSSRVETEVSRAAPERASRTRVAYFINCFPNYIEAMIYREVMALRERGYDVTTFSIRRPNDADVPREAKGLVPDTVYILPVGAWTLLRAHVRLLMQSPLGYLRALLEIVAGTHVRFRDRFRSLCHFAEAVVILPELQRRGIERVHAHWAVGAATCAMVVSRFLRIPFTFTAHAYDIWLDKLLLPEKLRAAETVVTCTDYNRRHLIDAYDAPASKLRVVYHGLDLERFQRRARPSNRRPVILSVGRLVEQKGYEHLLRVCAALMSAGLEFECEIIGDGPMRPRLEHLIDELCLRDVVRLAGRLVGDTIVERYECADLFALFCVEASDGDRDGIPNTMIEAMAMELPVVSTRYSGVPELVVEEVNGLLADCGDLKGLTQAVARLLSKPDLRIKMGKAARERVVGDFSTAAALAKLEDVFFPLSEATSGGMRPRRQENAK